MGFAGKGPDRWKPEDMPVEKYGLLDQVCETKIDDEEIEKTEVNRVKRRKKG